MEAISMKTLEQIKEIIKRSCTRDDRILALIFQLKENKVENIPKDPKFIHEFFYELKDNSNYGQKYIEFLKDFNFDIFGLFPHSEELDKVLFRLEASGLLGTDNPTYENYILAENEEEYEEAYKKFSTEDQTIIESMAKECINRL